MCGREKERTEGEGRGREGGEGEGERKPMPWFGTEKYPFLLLLMAATNKMCIDAKEIKNSLDGVDKAV